MILKSFTAQIKCFCVLINPRLRSCDIVTLPQCTAWPLAPTCTCGFHVVVRGCTIIKTPYSTLPQTIGVESRNHQC